MKSNLKRVLSLILISALAASMVSSCGQDASAPVQDEGSQSTGGSSATSDAKEHKLTVLGKDPTENSVKWSEREQYPVWQEFDKMLQENHITLDYELVTNEQFKVVIQTRMAAGSKLPDIANITPLDDTTALTLAEQGVIIDLTGPIAQYSDGSINAVIDKYYPNSRGLVQTAEGKQYWFPSQHYAFRYSPEGELTDRYSIYAVCLRKDWLDQLGIPDPATAEEFYEALKAFRDQDANGSGKADEVLVIDPKSFSTGIAQWFGLAPGLYGIDTSAGKVVSPWYQEGIKDYFAYMRRLVEEGILDTTGLANIGETKNQKCAENQLSGDFTYCTHPWLEDMAPVENANYMPLPPLPAKDGVTPYGLNEDTTLTWEKYVITKSCKDLEGAIKLFDLIHSEKYIELTSYGIEGVNWDHDADGVPTRRNYSVDEIAEHKAGLGSRFYSGRFIPIMQVMNYSQNPANEPDPIWRDQMQFEIDQTSYTPWYTDNNNNYLAMATVEESDEIASILTEANTFSEELSTKLILGQISLDDFDAQIAKFQDLKLDHLLEIQQGRLDRYRSLKS